MQQKYVDQLDRVNNLRMSNETLSKTIQQLQIKVYCNKISLKEKQVENRQASKEESKENNRYYINQGKGSQASSRNKRTINLSIGKIKSEEKDLKKKDC